VRTEYAGVNTLCPCNHSTGITDPFGVPLLPLDRTTIATHTPLPIRFTHILQPNGGKTLHDGDHIFATKPHPAIQGPFFRPDMGIARIEADGEFLQTDRTRAVVVNRFGVLDNVAVLYEKLSNTTARSHWHATSSGQHCMKDARIWSLAILATRFLASYLCHLRCYDENKPSVAYPFHM